MWNDLLTTALVGTERRALDLDNLPKAFKDLATQLEGHDAERTLLSLAGTLTLHRRVGQTPLLSDAPPLELCDLDDLPPCSPRAGLLLQQILALSQHGSHLQEWITLATRKGQRVSEEYLPRFLTNLNRSTLPSHFYTVLGKRGRWLAQQNEGWAYAVVPQNDSDWATASFPARLEYLRQLRTSDPVHVRALMGLIWKGEKAEARVDLLSTYKIALNLEDEPFLEAALDDRSLNVRQAAADLLAALPGSAYQARMIARAQSLIHIAHKRKKLVIDLTLPEGCDESMRRDGVGYSATFSTNLGTRAHWLFDIATALPAAFWLSGDWSPRDLVQSAVANQDWNEVLLLILGHIAEREQQHSLAEALLETPLSEATERAALRAAHPTVREAYALHLLKADPINEAEAMKCLSTLCAIDHEWSETLTRTFIDMARKQKPVVASQSLTALAGYMIHMPIFVQNMSLACVDDLSALAAEANKQKSASKYALQQAVTTLEFRRELHKEFNR